MKEGYKLATKIINIGNYTVNQYILQFNNGIIIIDTGYPKGFGRFVKKFESLGFTRNDIKFIVLTHAHDDHAGFLNELLEYCDASIILSEKAVDRLMIGQNVFKGGCTNRLAYLSCIIMKLLGKGKHSFPSVNRPERYITVQGNSMVLRNNGFPIDIIELPGHTLDSIGIVFDEKVFCGDAAMNGIPSIAKHIIWIEDKKDYMESWNKIINLNIGTVYPSHGRPFLVQKLIKHKNYLKDKKLIQLKK